MSVDKFGTGIKPSTIHITFPFDDEKLDFLGKKLTNIGYPGESGDAVNKQYISQLINGLIANLNENLKERDERIEHKMRNLRIELSSDIAKVVDKFTSLNE
jgi:hypothetical protein